MTGVGLRNDRGSGYCSGTLTASPESPALAAPASRSGFDVEALAELEHGRPLSRRQVGELRRLAEVLAGLGWSGALPVDEAVATLAASR